MRGRHLRHHLAQEAHVVGVVVRHIRYVERTFILAASHELALVREPVALIAHAGVPPGSDGSTDIPLKSRFSILADRLVRGLRPDRDEPKLLGLGEPARVELRVPGCDTLVDAVQIDHERHLGRLRGSDRCGHVGVPSWG